MTENTLVKFNPVINVDRPRDLRNMYTMIDHLDQLHFEGETVTLEKIARRTGQPYSYFKKNRLLRDFVAELISAGDLGPQMDVVDRFANVIYRQETSYLIEKYMKNGGGDKDEPAKA